MILIIAIPIISVIAAIIELVLSIGGCNSPSRKSKKGWQCSLLAKILSVLYY